MRPLYASRLEELEQYREEPAPAKPKVVLSEETRAKLRRTSIAAGQKRSRLARLGLHECPTCGSAWSAVQLARGCPTCIAVKAARPKEQA